MIDLRNLPPEMSEEEWLETRKQGIGASEIAAIAGLSRWKSPFDIWADKKGLLPPSARADNIATRMGKHLEPAILSEYGLAMGYEVFPMGRRIFRHPDHPFIFATPDAFAILPSGQTILIEAKSVGLRAAEKWGDPGSDAIPDDYRAQVAQQQSVFDLNIAHVPALFGVNDLRVFCVLRDMELERALTDAAVRFWNDNIIGNVPPDASHHPASHDALLAVFPRSKGDMITVDADSEDARALHELYEARAYYAQAEEERIAWENRLRFLIGDKDGIESEKFIVTWKSDKDKTVVDYKGIVAEAGLDGDLIAKHTTTVPGARRFLFKEKK